MPTQVNKQTFCIIKSLIIFWLGYRTRYYESSLPLSIHSRFRQRKTRVWSNRFFSLLLKNFWWISCDVLLFVHLIVFIIIYSMVIKFMQIQRKGILISYQFSWFFSWRIYFFSFKNKISTMIFNVIYSKEFVIFIFLFERSINIDKNKYFSTSLNFLDNKQ